MLTEVSSSFVVGCYNDRVALCCEDLEGVDLKWVSRNTVSLDDCHCVAINGEDVVDVTSKGDETEAVTLTCLYRNDRKWSGVNCASIVPATQTINEM